MFQITNLSNNPLRLSDRKLIAPGESRKLKEITEREENYQSRGWLSVWDETPSETPKAEEKTEKSGGKLK